MDTPGVHRAISTRALRVLVDVPQTHAKLFEDRVFGFQDWNEHRSAAWRHRMEPIVFMRVALGFVWQLVWVVIMSVLVALYHAFLVPLGAPAASTSLTAPFNMITFALSLLLVFKTNSSYSRWWEGRIIWGQIVNFGRNLPRMLLSWATPGSQSEEALRCALRWVAAAPHVLRGHIREQTASNAASAASHLLSPQELQYLSKWRNAPLGVCHVLSWLCTHGVGGMDPMMQAALQEQVSLYMNMSGGCERIQKTPIPSAYTRHTSRFLLIYCIFSPLMLWPSVTWATPFVACIIAFLLLGTENIGVQIEEPFRVLPLDAICSAIESNIRDMEALHFGDAPGARGLMPPPSRPETPVDAARGTQALYAMPGVAPGSAMWELLGLDPPAVPLGAPRAGMGAQGMQPPMQPPMQQPRGARYPVPDAGSGVQSYAAPAVPRVVSAAAEVWAPVGQPYVPAVVPAGALGAVGVVPGPVGMRAASSAVNARRVPPAASSVPSDLSSPSSLTPMMPGVYQSDRRTTGMSRGVPPGATATPMSHIDNPLARATGDSSGEYEEVGEGGLMSGGSQPSGRPGASTAHSVYRPLPAASPYNGYEVPAYVGARSGPGVGIELMGAAAAPAGAAAIAARVQASLDEGTQTQHEGTQTQPRSVPVVSHHRTPTPFSEAAAIPAAFVAPPALPEGDADNFGSPSGAGISPSGSEFFEPDSAFATPSSAFGTPSSSWARTPSRGSSFTGAPSYQGPLFASSGGGGAQASGALGSSRSGRFAVGAAGGGPGGRTRVVQEGAGAGGFSSSPPGEDEEGGGGPGLTRVGEQMGEGSEGSSSSELASADTGVNDTRPLLSHAPGRSN